MHPPLTQRLGLTLLLINPATATLAQEIVPAPDPDPLYKVELLVVRYSDPAAAAAETWDPTPNLTYPEAGRFLINPKRVAGLSREFAGSTELDTRGRLLITPGRGREAVTATDPDSGVEITPFELLAASHRELEAGANSLQRSGRYEILFHEAWVQPLQASSAAIPIVLDQSGDNGDWPVLQGSVKFYLSRYLHLETNLWLNTSGDYLPGRWWMPAPPLGPSSVLIDGEPLYIARGGEPVTNRPVTYSAVSGPVAGTTVTGYSGPSDPDRASGGGFRPMGPTGMTPGLGVAPEWQPPWPYRHSVPLTQKRRMRSNEVHYLDHPLLGVVVKLTPPQDLNLAGVTSSDDS